MPGCPGAPPRLAGRARWAGRDQEFAHRRVGRQPVKGLSVDHDPAGLLLTREMQLHDGHSKGCLLKGPGLVGQRLDFHRAVPELRVVVHDDAREGVVLGNELPAQVAEPDGLLAHDRLLPDG